MRFFPDLARHDRADPPGTESDAAFPGRERLGDTAATLAEVSREMVQWVPVLRRLAEAEQLRDLALGHSCELSAAAVRSIINARRLRDQYFWPAMSEPAWALLLELFANRLEGERLDATGLAMATGLPFDSTLHCLDELGGRAMITRGEAEDESRALVALTEAGADEMRAYLLAALRLSPWVQ